MSIVLGIDTSNYTTSVALYHSRTGEILQQKKLLPVKQGSIGLKQSDAVFAHIKQLPELVQALMKQADHPSIEAVGVSVRPRDIEGSYMPCFLTGATVADVVASVLDVPKYEFSHQSGHIMAALYSAHQMDLLNHPFLCFHVSGGTTECLHVTPKEHGVFEAKIAAKSCDLKAGQAIDRVGVMLGLAFPSGKYMDELSRQSTKTYKIRPTMKGSDCCLSGIENQCRKMFEQGNPKEDIAKYCIGSVQASVEGMTKAVLAEYGKQPIIYAGGVMSNSLIKEYMTSKYDAYFADPFFSSDNAAGIAILTALEVDQYGN